MLPPEGRLAPLERPELRRGAFLGPAVARSVRTGTLSYPFQAFVCSHRPVAVLLRPRFLRLLGEGIQAAALEFSSRRRVAAGVS